MNLWQAWNLSKTYRCRPSEIYSLEDEVTAYYFDKAVAHFGVAVDSDLENASENAKNKQQATTRRTMVLHKWLGEAAGPMFRTPGS